jgi:hypothetical protein
MTSTKKYRLRLHMICSVAYTDLLLPCVVAFDRESKLCVQQKLEVQERDLRAEAATAAADALDGIKRVEESLVREGRRTSEALAKADAFEK